MFDLHNTLQKFTVVTIKLLKSSSKNMLVIIRPEKVAKMIESGRHLRPLSPSPGEVGKQQSFQQRSLFKNFKVKKNKNKKLHNAGKKRNRRPRSQWISVFVENSKDCIKQQDF